MIIAGAFYLVGKQIEANTPTATFFHRAFVRVAITVATGVVLKLLGYASGIKLLEFTIAGIIVIAVSIFA